MFVLITTRDFANIRIVNEAELFRLYGILVDPWPDGCHITVTNVAAPSAVKLCGEHSLPFSVATGMQTGEFLLYGSDVLMRHCPRVVSRMPVPEAA